MADCGWRHAKYSSSETRIQPTSMTRTISSGSRSASPTTSASRTRKPASSTNRGPSPVGIVGRLIAGGRFRNRLQLDPELVELITWDVTRRAAHRVDSGLILRKGDDISQVRLAGENHDRPVDARSDTAVRWSSHREGVEQKAEPRTLLLGSDAQDPEHPLLDLGPVDSDGARPELVAVEDEVVGLRDRPARILLEHRLGFGRGRGERMVVRSPALLVFVPVEHREVDHPERPPRGLVDQSELVPSADPELPQDARDDLRPVGAEQDRGAGVAAKRRELLLGQELRDRRSWLTVLAVHDVREALRAPLLGEVLQLLEMGARVLLRHAKEAHCGCVGEDLERRAARHLRRVLDLEPEAEIRLVRAVLEHRVRVGHPRERCRELHSDRLAPDRRKGALDELEDEFAIRECHLEIELRQFLHAVGPYVFVSEAAGDLVVALESRDDEQLLVDLRGLRQREEATFLEARRHEEVPCPLGRRLGHDRRLDVDEAGGLHLAADDGDGLRAQADVPLQLLAPQVEPAVADAKRLVDALLVELERERRARGEDLQRVDLELDLAGRDVRVHVLRRAGGHLAGRPEDVLIANFVSGFRRPGRALRVDDELSDAGRVAQVHEDEPTVIAAARHPPGERLLLPHEPAVELTGAQVAPAHRDSNASASEGNSASCSPGRRSVTPSERTITVAFAPTRPACVSWPLSERPA